MSDGGTSYPHWLGLLKWSLSQTDPEGNKSDFTAMTRENREFLDAVMKDIVKDEPGDLRKILTMFQEIFERGVVSDDNDKIVGLLEDAQLIVDQIDMANVFLKFGGAVVLKNILSSEALSDGCKCSASVICGELAQNNPTAQVEMLKSGLLDQLAVVCASATTSSKLSAKSLYGISCIVRGSEEGESRFCETLCGPSLLQRVSQRQDDQCSKRVMFLGNALIMSDFSTSDRVRTILSAIIPNTFLYLNSSDVDIRETLLRLLSTSVSTAVGLDVLLSLLPSLQEALTAQLDSHSVEGDVCGREQMKQILFKISKRDEMEEGGHGVRSADEGGCPCPHVLPGGNK